MSTRFHRHFQLALLTIVLQVAQAAALEPNTPAAPNAPTTAPAAVAESIEPYWAAVTGDRVNLRSRPDGNSMVVARYSEGDPLRVVDQKFGWLVVEPPADVFSCVHADFITKTGENTGRVSVASGNLRVRVGSVVYDRDPLLNDVQTLLPDGTPVEIMGRSGDWLHIRPPQGVYFYFSPDYARRATPDEALKLAAKAKSAPTTTTQPTTGQPGTGQPTTAPQRPTRKWLSALSAVEEAISAQRALPIAKQRWAPTLAALQPLAAQDEDQYVAERAAARIEHVEHWQAAQQAIIAAEIALEVDPNAPHGEPNAPVAPAKPAASVDGFAATGVLQESFYIRTRTPPQFYKLVDPETEKLIAYVQFPAGQKGVQDWLGQRVGVRGSREADRVLGADVIMTREIQTLPSGRP